MLINELFPTVIGFSENKKHNNLLTRHLYKIQKQINSGGQNWGSTVYNTDGTYNLHKDLKFNKLNDWIFSEVNNYKDIIGYQDFNMSCSRSWFNIYKKYDYQEKHNHVGTDTISAVYFYKVVKDNSNLVFHSHEPESVEQTFDKKNKYTWRSFIVEPKEGLLVMFKSHLIHNVLQKNNNEKRISFAYNFKLDYSG